MTFQGEIVPRMKRSPHLYLTSNKPAGNKTTSWRLTSPVKGNRTVVFVEANKAILESLLKNHDRLPDGTRLFVAFFLPPMQKTRIRGDLIYTTDEKDAEILEGLAEVLEPWALYSEWKLGKEDVKGVLIPKTYTRTVKCPFCGYEAEYTFTKQLMSSPDPPRCPRCGAEVTVEDITSIADYIVESGERIIAHRDSREEYEIRFVKVEDDLYLIFWKEVPGDSTGE